MPVKDESVYQSGVIQNAPSSVLEKFLGTGFTSTISTGWDVVLPTEDTSWEPESILKATVGGIGDCWTQLFADYHVALDEEDYKEMRIDPKDKLDTDEFLEESRSGQIWVKRRAIRMRSLDWLIQNLMVAIEERANPVDYTRYTEDNECYICFEKKPEKAECSCYDDFDLPTESEEVRIAKEIHVKISIEAAFVFHISGCRWSSFENMYTRHQNGDPRDEPVTYTDLQKEGWISLFDIIKISHCKESVHLLEHIPGYKEKWKLNLGMAQVGADAAEMISECRRINTAELAKAHAQESFANDVSSIPRVNIRLSESECRQIKTYVGFPVMSNNKRMSTSDHKMLQASRELIRSSLRSKFPHNTDMASILHIGSTFHEFNVWKPNISHDFLFSLCEDRDVGRVYDDFVHTLGRELRLRKMPSIRSNKEKPQVVTHDGINDVVHTLNACLGRNRIFLQYPNAQYNSLMYEDCLYNVTEEQILNDFAKTGATTAWATLFLPDVFITNQCLASAFYRYEEYYDEVELARDFFKKIWPEFALIIPLFPLDDMLDAGHHFFSWVARKGAHMIVNWVKHLPDAKFPFEEIFGVTFDILKIRPIFNALLEGLRKVVKRHFCRVRITWKGGYDSGYDHKWHDWSKWVTTRRIRGKEFCIDWSIVDRIGEMYLLRLHKSSGTDNISFSMELPKEKTTVLVADIASAWSETRKVLGDLTYFPVLAVDWYKLYNWAMAEPIESLDFSVVLTTLNRIRGGLSLNSNVLVEAMHIQDTEAVKVALTCLLEVLKVRGVLTDIQNVKENLTGYHTNLTMLLKYMATTAATISTAGLIVPAVYLLKWLFDANPNYIFVKETVLPTTQTIRGVRTTISKKILFDNCKIPTTIVQKKTFHKTTCLICDLRANGRFKEKDNPNAISQEFICKNPNVENVHNIGFKTEDISTLTNMIRTVKSQHESFNAKSIVAALGRMQRHFEAFPGGIEHLAEIHHLAGGPGTGKSVVIRELADYYEQNGKSVLVVVPFNNLVPDYRNIKMLDGRRRDFEVSTSFHAATRSQTDVVIFDEITAMREDYVRAISIFLGAKTIWLVGDRHQTKLNTAAGEGVDPTSASWNWDKIQEHEMVWNFRLDAWRVKYLNKTYGYNMRTTRTDILPPLFVTREEFNVLREKQNIDREMVFSHTSASDVYGVESSAGRDTQNLSVRSSQGQTCKNAAITYMLADLSTADVHGMLCVAVSRAKFQTYFIIHDHQEDHVSQLKRRLEVDSQQNIDNIASMNLPEIKEQPINEPLDYKDVKVNNIMKEKRKLNKVMSQGDEVEEYSHEVKTAVPTTIILGDYKPPIEIVIENALDAFKNFFHLCALDVVLEVDDHIDTKTKAVSLLSEIYNDNVLMSRKSRIMQIFYKIKNNKPLPEKEGKKLLPLGFFEQLIKTSKVGSILVTVQGRVLSKSKPPEENRPIICFVVHDEHIVQAEITNLRRVPVSVGGEIYTAENLLTIIDGKFVGEYPLINRKTYGYVYELPLIDTDLLYPWTPDYKFSKVEVADYVGYKPTYRKLDLSDISHNEKTEMSKYAAPFGSYAAIDYNINKDPIVHQPRLGKDAYRIAPFIDPSGALLKEPCINNAAPFKGPEQAATISLNWEGFIWDRTKAGKIRRRPLQKYRAIAPGMANHYNNSPEETLIAAQRLGRPEPKPLMSAEARAFAVEVANHAYDTHFKELKVFDWQEANTILERGMRDAKARNYYNRAKAETKPFQRYILRLHNKDQIKPIKNDELNLEKGGQGILQSPSQVNLEFVCWMRVMNYLFYRSKKAHFFYDNLIPTAQFRKELTSAIASAPQCASIAIADAKSFDSQQSPLTLEIERQFMKRLGANMPSLEQYYKIRNPMEFRAFNLLSGNTKGEKGSGFPDTLLGNTILQTCLSTYVFEGIGPMVVAAKGDDHLRIQAGVKLNEKRRDKLKLMTNISLIASVGRGGEFCGDTITRKGAFPSIKRAAIKAIAMRAKNYNQFTEKQQALRDKIKEYQICGLEETVAYAADAENVQQNYMQACLAFINSYAHINKKQWISVTNVYCKKRFFLPAAETVQII